VLVAISTITQVALFSHLRLFGVVPDVGLVLTVAVAYRDGPEVAVLTGFGAGLAFDLFLETPFGLSALSYALAGYSVGVFQAGLLSAPGWVAPWLGLVGGSIGGSTFALVGALAGTDVLAQRRTFLVVLGAAAYDAVLAPVAFVVVRRVLAASEPAAWPGGRAAGR
jgi:rod shape-determining protein MreD